ncbi:PspC domain-containing protein [Microbacteriaceae bacterium VKM Ac-2855]|nr:PspC domain-containing protein [Microbacteriaceae bacterium VKM Ac-2855]
MNETSTPPPPNGSRSDTFFDWLRGLGVVRGPDSWIGGVCSAVAVRTGLDPLIVRGIFVVVGLLSGGLAVVAYTVGWALLPDTAGKIHAEQVTRGNWEAPSIAILIVAAVSVFNRGFWWDGAPGVWGVPDWLQNTFGTGWTLVIIGAIVWFTLWLIRMNRADRRRARETAGERTATDARTTADAAAAASAAAANASPAQPVPEFGSPESASRAFAPSTDPNAAAAEARANAARLRAEAEQVRREARDQRGTADAAAQQRQEAAAAKAEARRIRHHGEALAAEAHAAQWRRKRPGGGFVVIFLGLAAVIGGVAALLAAQAWGENSTDVLLVGGIAALAVLAIGMIISGVRGKVGGALSGFAFLLVVLIALGSIAPRDSELTVFGTSPTWQPTSYSSDEHRYSVLAGEPVLDLSALPATNSSGEPAVFDVWLGFGQAVVLVPEGLSVVVDSGVGAGSVNYSGDTGGAGERGVLFSNTQAVGPHDLQDAVGGLDGADGEADVLVNVHTLVGSIDVNEVSR